MMFRIRAILAVAALLSACGPSAPERLLEEVRLAFEKQNPADMESVVAACEEAWPSLKRIGTRHRESPEASEAFRIASSCLKRVYNFRRYTAPESPFVVSEPAFMLEWLAHFFAGEFPQEQVDQLLVGMPYTMFLEFRASSEDRPELARWEMRAKRDNGRVEYVRAIPASAEPERIADRGEG